jgi:hypothetical protein
MQGRGRRWIEWARSLRSKHADVARRHQPAAMMLARPRSGWMHAPSFHRHNQVWVTVKLAGVASAPAPTALRAILRETPAQPVRGERRRREQGQSARPPIKTERAVSRTVREVVRNFSPLQDPAKTPMRWETGITADSIARQVKVRTRRVEELVRVLRRRTAPSNDGGTAIRRVIQRFTRHEEQPARPPMTLRPTAPVPVETQHRPEDGRPLPPHGDWTTSPAFSAPHANANPAMNINIDALTSQVIDQIDRRLVARRERMGRF